MKDTLLNRLIIAALFTGAACGIWVGGYLLGRSVW